MARPIDEENGWADSYLEMSLNAEREREAAEWIEGLIFQPDDGVESCD